MISTTLGNTFTLSQRFQLSENIKAGKLIKGTMIVFTVNNIILMIVSLRVWYLKLVVVN